MTATIGTVLTTSCMTLTYLGKSISPSKIGSAYTLTSTVDFTENTEVKKYRAFRGDLGFDWYRRPDLNRQAVACGGF